jgi:hypothetical protein
VARRAAVQRVHVAALMVAILALAGCGGPAGVDGSLTNHWPAMPEPSLPAVTAPACYYIDQLKFPSSVSSWPKATPCTATHNVETEFVGAFTGAAAQSGSPPAIDGEAIVAPYAECARTARDYLGDDWRTSHLTLYVVVPKQAHWELGARWYRCDVVDAGPGPGRSLLQDRTTSLKGALAAPGALRLGCLKDLGSGDMIEVTCADGHNVEFAGMAELPPGPYPDSAGFESLGQQACLSVIAAFVGLPNDADLKYRVGWSYENFSPLDWARGNRGLRCFLYTGSKTLTGSMKGAGAKAFPVR